MSEPSPTFVSFEEAVEAVPRSDTRSNLKVDSFLERLADHPDLERVEAMLRSPDEYTQKRSADILTKMVGAYISEKAIKRWREAHGVV